jgi:hypothetical protein
MGKIIFVVFVTVLVLVLIAPAALAKPDMDKPLSATDIELVKKVTVKGKPAGGGKPSPYATTGQLGAPLPDGASKYAILVGISDYPGDAYDLSYCDDDALDMKMALTQYRYTESNIYLFLDDQATRQNIKNAIDAVKNRANIKDEVVFFFSGHGSKGTWTSDDTQDIQQGVDLDGTDESIVAHNGSQLVNIWDGELRQWFASINAARIIFIFDSCLAGGMTDLAVANRVINMACTEKGVSYEYTGLQNGQFTYFFVDQGMLGGKADRYDHDKDGILREPKDVVVEEAFDYAKANCRRQTPAISDSFSNDLLL